MTGVVSGIQRFSMHDGPGIRTTVFLKGCPLRCPWCHNPETRDFAPQVEFAADRCIGCGACAAVCPVAEEPPSIKTAGADRCRRCFRCVTACLPGALRVRGHGMSVGEVLDEVARDLPFYGAEGGMTLSGGEPMAQPEFSLALLREAKARGIGTAIETCCAFPACHAEALASLTDTIFCDLKDTDPERYLANTGIALAAVEQRIGQLAALAADRMTLRCILLRGVNDNGEHISRVRDFARSHGIRRVELLAFHPLGGGKYAALGMSPPADFGAERIPDKAALARLRAMLD